MKFLASGQTNPRRIRSGRDLTPPRMVSQIEARAKDWRYDVVSIGYPGLVGRVGPIAEPTNIGAGWTGFDFSAAFDRPVKIVNDATLQAIGSYDGGRMLFIGLGTGVGSVLILEGKIIQFELGELRWQGRTMSSRFGNKGLEEQGKRRWRNGIFKLLPSLQRAFVTDYIVAGGGNARHLHEPLPPNIRIGHNNNAFRGGDRLWGLHDGANETAPGGQAYDWQII